MGMTGQRLAKLCARMRIPDAHCFIARTRDDLLTVNREGDGVDFLSMAFKRISNCGAGLDVPDPDRLVTGTGRDSLTIM